VEQLLVGIGVEDDRTYGYTQDNVVGASAILILAASVLAIFGAMQAGVTIVDECIDIAVGHGKNAAAATAVAAVRPSLGNELLAAKAGHAISALAGNDFYGGFVYEFHQ